VLAITGSSMVNALGTTREAVWQRLVAGQGGLTAAQSELPFSTCVGKVAALAPLSGGLRAWDTRLARMAQTLIAALDPVLARTRARWHKDRIAVLLGTSTAGAEATERAYRAVIAGDGPPADYDFGRQHTFGALLHVVRALTGADGPAWMVSTACTSSAKPLASASRLLETGVIDAAIVGGVDTLCHMTLRGFHALSALSPAPCRPFSAGREGISIGEGGAFLVLERQGDAVGFVEGIGESSDAYHISAPHPQGAGAFLAMERALPRGGAVDHVNAHGTGTLHNDLAESKAIVALLGPEVPVISTKGYTGHTLGGAGATEVALALLMMEHGEIAASLGALPVDPQVEANIVTARTRARLTRVLSNSFAFGGSNVSISLRAA
jgi:3-oxoacyl-[acyl-carrier-protein] synthase-1